MTGSSFARTSFFVKGMLVIAIASAVFGAVFHSHLSSSVQAQEPVRTALNIGSAPQPKAVATTTAEILLGLAGTVSQRAAAERLIDYKLKNDPSSKPRYYGIVDFDQPSTRKRFYIIDTVERTIEAYYVSHGRGSEGPKDDGIADVFSNQDGSNSSSLGIYRTLGEYEGKHGRSLRLEGLESTNSNVLARGVVLHTADYVSDAFIRQTGRLGRSEGCFAVEPAVGPTLMNELKPGTYIIAVKN